ncbi:uncharacterized protein PV09_08475 [Verruconis gallopava]|uniref:Uncharacterized protein n=1 Tax=Verruconis gallopava TaxID=253628 RepID=A0A0D2A003_9PEZI|nr:uncharacterized protein PV09_08475 [Verruconis gallopava]KIV99962.1 hypothetical protein PV09_08475 [Verruconis gallopava]
MSKEELPGRGTDDITSVSLRQSSPTAYWPSRPHQTAFFIHPPHGPPFCSLPVPNWSLFNLTGPRFRITHPRELIRSEHMHLILTSRLMVIDVVCMAGSTTRPAGVRGKKSREGEVKWQKTTLPHDGRDTQDS